MDDSTYRHLLSKIKKSGTLAHHNFPSHNLLSVDNLRKSSENISEHEAAFLAGFPCYQQFPYNVVTSYPIFCGSGVSDDATVFLNRKLKWEKQLQKLKLHDIEKALKQINELQENKVVRISSRLRKYINHFQVDPEPKFSGNYNWLYTGGTLSFVKENDEVTLVMADSFNRKPSFNVLKLNRSLNGIENQSSFTMKSNTPIFQITSQARQDSLITCIRQKNHLNLFSIQRNSLSPPIKVLNKKVAPPKLIVSADVNPECDKVILSDSSLDVHVFHLEQKNKIHGFLGRRIRHDLRKDSWSQAAFGELGMYVAFRNCFAILDFRDFSSSAAFEYNPSPFINNCEGICSWSKSSLDSRFVYLATTHSVLQLDLRNGETIQKWTHLLKNPPQFMTTVEDSGESEVVLLQSQIVDEISGIVNKCKEDQEEVRFTSESLPCLLNSMKESLRVAQLSGVCLSPVIAERINFVVTGMGCQKNSSGDLIIFTTNSPGDIFTTNMQRTTSGHSPDDKDNDIMLQAMKTYESLVENFPPKPFQQRHLDITDMSHVLRGLRQRTTMVNTPNSPEPYWKYNEIYSPESLAFSRDLMSQKILKVWGYLDEEPDKGDITMSAEDKVREWMHKN